MLVRLLGVLEPMQRSRDRRCLRGERDELRLVRYKLWQLTFECGILCSTLLFESLYIAVAVAFFKSQLMPELVVVRGGGFGSE